MSMKKQKKTISKRIRTKVSSMMGFEAVKQSHSFFHQLGKNILTSSGVTSPTARTFAEATIEFGLSDQQIIAQKLYFRKQGYIYFLFFMLFAVYISYRILTNHILFNTLYVLAELIMLMMSLRAFYFAYLIEQKNLSLSFLSYLYSFLVRR